MVSGWTALGRNSFNPMTGIGIDRLRINAKKREGQLSANGNEQVHPCDSWTAEAALQDEPA